MPVVEGHWQCIGSLIWEMTLSIAMVARGSHETAVVFEGLEANLGTMNFIFDSATIAKQHGFTVALRPNSNWLVGIINCYCINNGQRQTRIDRAESCAVWRKSFK